MLVGIDVGSTTVKIVVLDPDTKEILHSKYERHNAEQGLSVRRLLKKAHDLFPNRDFRVALCGSAGQSYAKTMKTFYIQEVVANSLAIKEQYPDTRVAIELGGQDAKVIFFDFDTELQQLVPSDMRMNGSCAGGTGAFIDQIAELLNISTEEFNDYASRGENLYEISGRCGVFAKTDIQPLLNQGVSKEDIALSSFHALAKQTIGGLAQGMTIRPKVIFEGGPLTFNPRLIDVFKERLELNDDQIIVPPNPELMVAYGAALSIELMYGDDPGNYEQETSDKALLAYIQKKQLGGNDEIVQFFESEQDKNDFIERHRLPPLENRIPQQGETVNAYLGIDAGSTTSKFVLIDEDERPIYSYYSPNKGEPLEVVLGGMKQLRDFYREHGAILNILGTGSTGYGENLFAKAFKADYHCVETVAHARAARKYAPDVTFILDIGGQDMKAISLSQGVVSGIVLNEACSAGCGSFIETYAKSLGVAPEEIAELAFKAENPSHLGSRCTVFMNSSIITEQKNGKTTADILAGICRSIVENVFTKVVRVSNWDQLGTTIVVQGGTFKNDAVLRALEQYSGRTVVRAPYPGEMGAIGVALLTKEHVHSAKELAKNMNSWWSPNFPGLQSLDNFSYTKRPGVPCNLCANHCMRTIIEFSDGSNFVTGNRCEKGEIIGDIKDERVRRELKEKSEKRASVPDMMALQHKLIFEDYPFEPLLPANGISIGLPRALEFWNSMPFWKTLFKTLGFKVVLSSPSSYHLFDTSLPFVPSDTVCFPAKLSHGHIESLCKKGVNRIFFPQLVQSERENLSADSGFYCAIIQGYSMVVEKSNETKDRFNVPIDHPVFHWFNKKVKIKQISDFLHSSYKINKTLAEKAIEQADQSMELYYRKMEEAGKEALENVKKTGSFGVLVAARPYHMDPLVNHDLSKHFTQLGIPVFTIDSLGRNHNFDLSVVKMETTMNFHTRMIEATMLAAKEPALELVQVVSFGCGHDAVISDEMTRILRESAKKEMLILKMDEGEASGPLSIRIKSFMETIKGQKKQQLARKAKEAFTELKEAFPVKFERRDKHKRTIYVPNLSPSFSFLFSEVLKGSGYQMETLPLANDKAIELGKRYVHNDICYPAQINIGEFLANLENGTIDPQKAALGIAKNCEDCRAGQYPALARKALDDFGYPDIPLITSGKDKKKMHPGFNFTLVEQWHLLWGLTMIDGLEKMRRRLRPYEVNQGECKRVFDYYMKSISQVSKKNKRKGMAIFKEAITVFNRIEIKNIPRLPRVGIIGEILMNYHPAANIFIEDYLERYGMEVLVPDMHDFFQKAHLINNELASRGASPQPFIDYMSSLTTGSTFDYIHKKIEGLMQNFKFYQHSSGIRGIAQNVDNLIDLTYIGAEGWKLPGEIIEMEKEGVNSFVIIQPFGCLPNHITGRGFIKPLKKMLPHIQILSLDFDPDTSTANIENRLQMLIINARELEKRKDQSIHS